MLTRRQLLRSTAVLGIAAPLGACSSHGSSGAGGTAPNAAETPTYVAFGSAKPDVTGDPALGIPNGYYRYPDAPPKFTSYPLPKTQPMSFLKQGPASSVALGQSERFKALCADVGNDMMVTSAGFLDEYVAKFQTMVAGSDLPEVMQTQTVPQLDKLLAAKFTPLGEFIGGDRVKEYPGLASIPTTAWAISTINGKLWGIPQARPPAGKRMYTRGDLLAKKGIAKNQAPKNGAELLDLMKELTDKSASQFAMGQVPTNGNGLLYTILEMLDAPNNWREKDGKFTNAIETDEHRAALTHSKAFWDAGVMHPNTFTEPLNLLVRWQAGQTMLYQDSFLSWAGLVSVYPEYDTGVVDFPRWDGGGACTTFTSNPAYGGDGGGFAAISKQTSPDRVREILRVLDYFAAPYGTEEYLRVNYGAPGKYHTMKDGVPVPTKAATGEPNMMAYFGSQSNVNLVGQRAQVDLEVDYLRKVMPAAGRDASVGLYSDTNISKGATFLTTMTNMINDFVQGRASLSDWDSLIADWKRGIGKTIRQEYEQAFAQSHK